ncbi:MAG: AmmeMemoRadiSam system radical SAM enzyme, partial [Methanosarcinales archaeon]
INLKLVFFMEKEAMLWESINKKVKCKLCAWRCTIADKKRGFCRVRENRDGKLYTLNYALASSVAIDPIEKKPLFHFYPKSSVFSLGTVSCNFSCLHCQNYDISKTNLEEFGIYLREIYPEEAVKMAKYHKCKGIAFTYNEPTIWFEYTYDTAKIAKENGLYTVYVTNGYMTLEALDTIAPYLDAMNIDVKSFTEKFYKEVCSVKLKPVLETVENANSKGIHVEVTYLVIPGYNDNEEEFKQFVDWMANLDINIPVHFTRFYPAYEMSKVSPTPLETLEKARDLALKKLRYVYIGNIASPTGENTYCYNCGKLLISRRGYIINKIDITKDNKCPSCKSDINIVV